MESIGCFGVLLFPLIGIIAAILAVIGIDKPEKVLYWGRKREKNQALVFYGSICIGSFMMFFVSILIIPELKATSTSPQAESQTSSIPMPAGNKPTPIVSNRPRERELTKPDTMVKRYYQLINEKRLKEAFALRSKRSTSTLKDFEKSWSNNDSVSVNIVSISKQNDSEAVVEAKLISKEKNSSTDTYKASIKLSLENGDWRYNGGDFNKIDDSGQKKTIEYSDILKAIKANNLQAVEDCINKNPSLINYGTISPLSFASTKGHKDIAELLISKGADVNYYAKSCGLKWTPLNYAVDDNHKDIAELLISKGANVNTQDIIGMSPLHYAGSKGYKDITELLVSKGADINAKDNRGCTPLHFAGSRDIAELYISKGADIHQKNKEKRTPLHCAHNRGVAELLIFKGADINAKGLHDWTPLHEALQQEHKDVAELLIEKGADINEKDVQDYTPLHYACMNNYPDIVELLLKNGAEVHAKTIHARHGDTPMDMTRNENIKRLLRKYGAAE